MLLTNIEKWSRLPAFATVFSGCARDDFYHINGGFLVLHPNIQTYNELLQLASSDISHWEYSEQELLTVYYLFQRPNITAVLGNSQMQINYLSITGQQTCMSVGNLGEIPDKHTFANLNTKSELLETIDAVHFTCSPKPWNYAGMANHWAQMMANKWSENCRKACLELQLDCHPKC